MLYSSIGPIWQRASFASVATVLLSIACPRTFAAATGVTAIPQFSGQFHENFNASAPSAHASLRIFSDQADAVIEGDNNSVKIELSSSLNGDLVTPISGRMMGQLGIMDWEFAQPVRQFGGFWENNSGADDATVQFYAVGNALLGSLPATDLAAAQHWTWNGWNFDTPVEHIRVTGNGVVNGFLWYDNMELTLVPEPATLTWAGLLLLGALRRRH